VGNVRAKLSLDTPLGRLGEWRHSCTYFYPRH